MGDVDDARAPGCTSHLSVADRDATGGGRDQTADETKQAGLTRPARADDCNERAVGHFEVHVVEDDAAVELQEDVLEDNGCHEPTVPARRISNRPRGVQS